MIQPTDSSKSQAEHGLSTMMWSSESEPKALVLISRQTLLMVNLFLFVFFVLFCLFVCFLDLVFVETGFLYIALAVLELTLQTRLSKYQSYALNSNLYIFKEKWKEFSCVYSNIHTYPYSIQSPSQTQMSCLDIAKYSAVNKTTHVLCQWSEILQERNVSNHKDLNECLKY